MCGSIGDGAYTARRQPFVRVADVAFDWRWGIHRSASAFYRVVGGLGKMRSVVGSSGDMHIYITPRFLGTSGVDVVMWLSIM